MSYVSSQIGKLSFFSYLRPEGKQILKLVCVFVLMYICVFTIYKHIVGSIIFLSHMRLYNAFPIYMRYMQYGHYNEAG